MSKIGIKLNADDMIVGNIRTGKELPPGHIEITQAQFDKINQLKKNSREDGSGGKVYWKNNDSELASDSRPTAAVTFNGGTDNIFVEYNTSFTMRVDLGNKLTKTIYVKLGGDRYKLDFTNGIAERQITMDTLDDFVVASNDRFKSNRIVARVYK